MKKERKSLDSIKDSKVDASKVHGGKMDLQDNMRELDINQIIARDVLPVKRGQIEKGGAPKSMENTIRPTETK